MKVAFIIILTLTTICINSVAQEIPEPDFSQKPYYLKDGKLFEFEKVEASLGTKAKGMGYGGVEISYSAEGQKSPVRFPSSSALIIVVKMEDNSDPSDGFTVLLGDVKKNGRRFVTGKMGTFGGLKSNNANRISISSRKLREKLYEISFSQPLQPGEYAIISNQKSVSMANAGQSVKMNCFGVD